MAPNIKIPKSKFGEHIKIPKSKFGEPDWFWSALISVAIVALVYMALLEWA